MAKRREWGWGDSNPHGVIHMILSHARLPIPPHPRIRNFIIRKIESLDNCENSGAWANTRLPTQPALGSVGSSYSPYLNFFAALIIKSNIADIYSESSSLSSQSSLRANFPPIVHSRLY